MQKRVMINMMGDFSISVDGVPHAHLVAKSRKGISLLQYLILERGKHVPSQRLVRELWSGSHCDGPENALKTMVSRVRGILNELSPGLGRSLTSGNGGYYWAREADVGVDALELMDLLERLGKEPAPADADVLMDRVQELYVGDLYITGDMLNGQTLVNWLHREYIDAVLAHVARLKQTEQYNRVCEVCRAAIRVDDLDDQLHIELMQAMVNLNRVPEAMVEYRKVARQTRRALDMEPSEDLQACYQDLVEAQHTLKFNLDVIRNELIEHGGGRRGPFFCDYRAFKEIYNIHIRNLERLGSTMFLGVIMLGEPGDGMSAVSRESGMAGLQEILRNNLRKGDIITRFSDNIYAMLLPTVNYDTGTMVMDRIKHLFYQEYPAGNIPFHSRISPLGEV